MGQNLTGKLIKNTYEDLVQISGSILTDGTGSDITNLTVTSSFATTASYAENAAGVPLALFTASISDATITFTKGNASTFPITVNNVSSSISSSYALQAGTAGFASQAGTSGFAVSSSYASQANTAGYALQAGTAGFATSASFADQAGTSGFAVTASFASTASSLIGGISLQTVLDTGNTATQDIILTGDISATNITGSTVYASSGSFVNLNAVSASFGYVKTITGSAVIIGDEFIILNADTPTARYAGLVVYDSGSGSPATASLEWDGDVDTWITVEESGNSSVILTGPTGSKGSETFPTLNKLQKGGSWNYLVDSNISDSGILVSINSNTQVTGSLNVSAGITGSLEGTASFASSASYATNALSASFATTASYAENAAGVPLALFTASISDATITFTKGDASTFPITVNNVNNAISASFAATASFALSSSADTQTLQDVTDNGASTTNLVTLAGGLTVSGSALISGSLGTGRFIDNVGTPTASAAIEHLVYISQSEYNALTPNNNTMYVITSDTGATILTDTVVSGSLLGYVNSLTVASSTASMDCSLGNFFTLQLVSGSNVRVEPSNIAAGQTINVRVNTTGSGTVSFPSSVKQVSGSSYVPTTTTGVDVITFISFDTSALYLSNVKNLV